MTQMNQIYKCEICGNIAEVLHTGAGSLVCCGQQMVLQEENKIDAAQEKHVPVILKKEGKILIKIGEIDHPMVDEHYIEWIEIIVEEKVYRKYLKPGDEPMAEFGIEVDKIKARAYCNQHGLWES